jgi:hypothetical protein
MTLDEAIKVIEKELEYWSFDRGAKYLEAWKLGIEALRAIKEMRTEGCFQCQIPLPGETKE